MYRDVQKGLSEVRGIAVEKFHKWQSVSERMNWLPSLTDFTTM